MSHNVYRDGKVYVRAELCSTCVFRPGNPMSLSAGRLREMVDSARETGTAIICHQTLEIAGCSEQAVCRGFAERYPTDALVLAAALGVIEEVDG